jgi:hypothetical protein
MCVRACVRACDHQVCMRAIESWINLCRLHARDRVARCEWRGGSDPVLKRTDVASPCMQAVFAVAWTLKLHARGHICMCVHGDFPVPCTRVHTIDTQQAFEYDRLVFTSGHLGTTSRAVSSAVDQSHACTTHSTVMRSTTKNKLRERCCRGSVKWWALTALSRRFAAFPQRPSCSLASSSGPSAIS